MSAKFPIPRPTERAALANLGPRPVHSPVALYSDLATTHRRRDWEGFGLVGHMLLRAIAGKAGERS
jgi:hypothetical protein